MISRLKNLVHWGCATVEAHTLQRKILHTNITACVTILSMAGFAVLNLAIGNRALTEVALICLPSYFASVAVLLLNRRGHTEAARWLMSLSLTATVTTLVFAVYGSRFGVHFYFVVFSLLAVTLFPLRKWKSMLCLFLLNAALFLYSEFAGIAPHPALHNVSAATVTTIRAGFAGAILATIFIIVWLGEVVADNSERKLESLSGTDALTRLPNRRRMQQRLAEIIASSKRTGQYGAVLFIDLDNFKPLNDIHGHVAGDLLLQEAALRISDSVREVDVVARYGGDEFVVILGHLGHENELARKNAQQTAEKVRQHLGQPYGLVIQVKDGSKRVEHSCTSSIGVALFQGEGAGEEHIIKCADAAMYQAKSNGRNAICFH